MISMIFPNHPAAIFGFDEEVSESDRADTFGEMGEPLLEGQTIKLSPGEALSMEGMLRSVSWLTRSCQRNPGLSRLVTAVTLVK